MTSPCKIFELRPLSFIVMVVGPVRATVIDLSSRIPADAGIIEPSETQALTSVAFREAMPFLQEIVFPIDQTITAMLASGLC